MKPENPMITNIINTQKRSPGRNQKSPTTSEKNEKQLNIKPDVVHVQENKRGRKPKKQKIQEESATAKDLESPPNIKDSGM